MIFRLPIMALVCVVALTGCISVKSYVDPAYTKTHYENLKKPAEALPLKVNVEFSRNGKPLPKADDELRGNVERILRASGLVTPAESAANGEIMVRVNNVGDLGSAGAKGFGTGLTFGLVGSTVQDGYEMVVELTTNGTMVTKSGYKDVLVSTVGNKSAPKGLTPISPSAAFSTIVEQMLLNALGDFQADGLLVAGEDAHAPIP